jgi:surfactin synthase thioesterase subunit
MEGKSKKSVKMAAETEDAVDDSYYEQERESPNLQSRRRGRLSINPLQIERRQWYAEVEAENRKRYEEFEYYGDSKPDDADEHSDRSSHKSGLDSPMHKTSSPPRSSPHTHLVKRHGSPVKTASSPSHSSAASSPVKSFASLSLDLFEEISAKSGKSSYLDEKPAPPKQYVRNKRFNTSRWVTMLSNVREESTRASKVLICFPGFGESHLKYTHWPHMLELLGMREDQVEVWGVCLPGRALRTCESCFPEAAEASSASANSSSKRQETSDYNILNISAAIVEALIECNVIYKRSKRVKRHPKQVYLFGHAVGALIAFEVARLLISQENNLLNIKVEHLITSSQASAARLSEINIDQFRHRMSTRPFKELYYHFSAMKMLPRELLERRELLSMFMQLVKTDLRLAEEYYLYPKGALLNSPDILFDTNNGEFGEETQASKGSGGSVGVRGGGGRASFDASHGAARSLLQSSNSSDPHNLNTGQGKYDFSLPVLEIPLTTFGCSDDPYIASEDMLLHWGELTEAPHSYFVFPTGFGAHSYLSTSQRQTDVHHARNLFDEFIEGVPSLDDIRFDTTHASNEDMEEDEMESKHSFRERERLRIFRFGKSAVFNSLIVIACILRGGCNLKELMNSFLQEFYPDS